MSEFGEDPVVLSFDISQNYGITKIAAQVIKSLKKVMKICSTGSLWTLPCLHQAFISL